jgi:hypothetical protein
MPATLGPYNGLTWNWDDYDASSNPRGLGNGGFREETGLKLLFESVLADVAASLRMTATDSVAIGTGAKTFTPATMRGVTVGMDCYAIYDANNRIFGTITAVTATQVTITVPTGGTTGSGTYASWTLQPTGPRGPEPNIGKIIGAVSAAM